MYLLSIVEGKKKNAKPVFFHRQPPSGQEWMRLYIKSNLLGIKSKNWPDKKYWTEALAVSISVPSWSILRDIYNCSCTTYHSKWKVFFSKEPNFELIVVVVELLSCVQLFVTPWTTAHQISLSFTISRSLLRFTSIESLIEVNLMILSAVSDHTYNGKGSNKQFFKMDLVVKPS